MPPFADPKLVKSLANQIALSTVLDDDRKVAALQNLNLGVYTQTEVQVLSFFHITSTALKVFFLSKSYKMLLIDGLSTKNHAAFYLEKDPNVPLTEEQRLIRAGNFNTAEASTIVRAGFYFRDDSDYLKVMWLDPTLMKMALEQDCKEIQRKLYQTDEMEKGTWTRLQKQTRILMPSVNQELS